MQEQPPVDPTVPSQPQPVIAPTLQSAGAPGKRRLLAIIIAAVAVVILLIVIVVANLGTSQAPSKTGIAPVADFTNKWLNPSSVLKVGSYRYVSPCQVLPGTAAAMAYGGFGSDTTLSETYLDQSVGDSDTPPQASCQYTYSLDGQSVKLVAEQYASLDKLRDISTSLVIDDVTIDDTAKAVSTDLSAAKASGDKSAIALAQTMSGSLTKLRSYVKLNTLDPTQLAKINLDGLVIPNTDSADLGVELMTVHGNVLYRLTYNFPTDQQKSDGKYSNSQLASMLSMDAKALNAIGGNLQKAMLNQSPAPTVIGGSGKNGSTKALEPCVILTSANFAQLIGKAQNQPVGHVTPPIDLSKARTADTGDALLPLNSCTRAVDDGTNNTTLGLDINTAASVAAATRYTNAFTVVDSTTDKTIQTDADWAFTQANAVDPTAGPLYYFRVGAYVGEVSISTLQSGDSYDTSITTPGTNDQYIQAINTFTAAIRAQSR